MGHLTCPLGIHTKICSKKLNTKPEREVRVEDKNVSVISIKCYQKP